MKMKQKSQSKLVIAMSAVILLLVALSATLTFAYFTDSKGTTDNQGLKFDTLSLDVTEAAWTKAASEKETLTTLVPGCTVNMGGSVKLTGAAAYLKVDFTVECENAPDNVAIDAIKTALGAALNAQANSTNKWFQVTNDETDKAWYCTVSLDAAEKVIDFANQPVVFDKETMYWVKY